MSNTNQHLKSKLFGEEASPLKDCINCNENHKLDFDFIEKTSKLDLEFETYKCEFCGAKFQCVYDKNELKIIC